MKVVVVASGDVGRGDVAWLDDAGLVIAADGGAGTLESLSRRPDLLVGDLDSVPVALVERLSAAGTRVERHPVDKEASDAELAVGAAIDAGASQVVVLGAFGGDRLDHELANVLLLADPALAAYDVRAVRGDTRIRAVHGGARLDLEVEIGDMVTLLPVAGDAVGVTTAGLRWPLDGATLRIGHSRGLSNVVVAVPASVGVASGTLLVVESASKEETT
jgi:thiamine pyrophosphokinase